MSNSEIIDKTTGKISNQYLPIVPTPSLSPLVVSPPVGYTYPNPQEKAVSVINWVCPSNLNTDQIGVEVNNIVNNFGNVFGLRTIGCTSSAPGGVSRGVFVQSLLARDCYGVVLDNFSSTNDTIGFLSDQMNGDEVNGVRLTNGTSNSQRCAGLFVDSYQSTNSNTFGVYLSNLNSNNGITYGISGNNFGGSQVKGIHLFNCSAINDSTGIHLEGFNSTNTDAYGLKISDTHAPNSTAYGIYLERGTKNAGAGGQLLKLRDGNLCMGVQDIDSQGGILFIDGGNYAFTNNTNNFILNINPPSSGSLEEGMFWNIFKSQAITITVTPPFGYNINGVGTFNWFNPQYTQCKVVFMNNTFWANVS